MKKHFERSLVLIVLVYALINSCFAFQKIASDTGQLWGVYSLKWGAAFAAYFVFCVLLATVVSLALWRMDLLRSSIRRMVAFRELLGNTRWLLAFLALIAPVWFLQYTPWGVVFKDIYIRLIIWFLTVSCLAFFIMKGQVLIGWKEFLAAILLTSSAFVIAFSFINVTDYPFSLSWSEGNRIWDYSMLFARHLYDYPTGQDVFVHLDLGRQFVGGLPFIFPYLSIEMERFWLALTIVIPYILLGLATFRFARADPRIWLFATLWVLIFLKQGPIHPPLILCAVAVALLWRAPLWCAIPLIALTGYIAEESRFTWIFAPGMWIGMLELTSTALHEKKLDAAAWIRAILLGLSGMLGGQFGQTIAGMLAGNMNVGAATSIDGTVSMVSDPTNPLLWYRLLPNETYTTGILVGLLIAIFPLVFILLHLIFTKKVTFNIWQALAVILPLFAFLTVGLIVSTKIGGGGDLHNLDMFLIGLVFVVVVMWEKGGRESLANIDLLPVWVKIMFVLLFAIPGFQSLNYMRSYDFGEDVAWIIKLRDIPDERFLDMHPSDEKIDGALDVIREQVALARSQGRDVLFMDQRQLLTFGYIKDVPFIPEYEKKIVMHEALSSNPHYFNDYYADLAAHRFALIISEPLHTPIMDSSFQFGEENNAWVTWVAVPTLCYYEPLKTLREVNVQLLVPKTEPVDCQSMLP